MIESRARTVAEGRGGTTALLLLGLALWLVAGNASAGVEGSAHDFSSATWATNNANGELCAPCHTPHEAQGTQLVPLWSHEATAQASFTLYSSDTLDATINDPTGISLSCLSCHDGTIALNSYRGNPSSGDKMGAVNSDRLVGVGGDMTGEHPVSFDYEAAQALDAGLNASSTTVPEIGGQTIAAAMLVNGNMECSSCHDVHEEKGESATAPSALIVDNGGSDLCWTCQASSCRKGHCLWPMSSRADIPCQTRLLRCTDGS